MQYCLYKVQDIWANSHTKLILCGTYSHTSKISYFELWDQLDMLLLGSVVCTICEDDDVGVWSGHKPTKWQRTTIEYVHKAYSVYRKTFLHGISKHKIHAIKDHYLDNGISPREHGNTGKHPKHSLSFKNSSIHPKLCWTACCLTSWPYSWI